MSTVREYSAMERSDLEALRAQKVQSLAGAQKQIQKLKKKFRSGSYDRQVICEHIISFQRQSEGLRTTIAGIDSVLNMESSRV